MPAATSGPLTESRAFTGVLVRGGEHPEAPGWFLRTFRAMADEPAGFEFMVREELSHLCMMLAESFAGQGGGSRSGTARTTGG